jgi:hypothetical protein
MMVYRRWYMNAAPTEGDNMADCNCGLTGQDCPVHPRNTTTEPLAAHALQGGDLLLCFEEFTQRPVFREVFEVEQDRDGDRLKVRVSDRDTPSLTLWLPRDLCVTRRVTL